MLKFWILNIEQNTHRQIIDEKRFKLEGRYSQIFLENFVNEFVLLFP